MAQCPKCGKKLHFYNWRPNCPNCGVNIMFSGYEKQFAKDRRITEMTLARTKVNFMRFKCSFIGSVFAKIRIAAVLIPIAGLFASFGSFTLSTPIYSKAVSFNIMGLVDMLTGGYLNGLKACSGSVLLGSTLSALSSVLFSYLAVAIIALLILITEMFCFLRFKRGSAVMSAMGCLGIVASVCTQLMLTKLSSTAASVCSVDIGAGVYIQIACFLPVIIFSAILAKKDVNYVYAPGDKERVEYYRKYKKGEIDLMDIPAPIFLSDDEKAEKARLTKELFNINEQDEKEEQNV